MDADFWYQRWRENRIGFHETAVNPLLIRHWDAIRVGRSARVLVPLCGKSLDMIWLASRGHRVVGVELSPVATEAFFTENDLDPRVRQRDGFEVWDAGDIRIFCGDFFALMPKLVGRLGAVYDRASLIALPPDLRPRYVQHLVGLMSRGPVPQLLITLEYRADEVVGPPFSVAADEVRAVYAGHYEFDVLADNDALDANPNLRRKGITALREIAWRLLPRAGAR